MGTFRNRGVMKLNSILFYPIGNTPGCLRAAEALRLQGIAMADHPSPEVTHLLLDVPGFCPDGTLRGGGELSELLRQLPEEVTIISGKIPETYSRWRCMDFLKDEEYLWENAAITAQCAVQLAARRMGGIFRGETVLIIGWGRIGKHLARLLLGLGAQVSLMSRSDAHKAEAESFGIHTEPKYDCRVVFNTAPGVTLDEEAFRGLKFELASTPGFRGDDVIEARGLPGIYAPEQSGKLIAKTILRKLGGKV